MVHFRRTGSRANTQCNKCWSREFTAESLPKLAQEGKGKRFLLTNHAKLEG